MAPWGGKRTRVCTPWKILDPPLLSADMGYKGLLLWNYFIFDESWQSRYTTALAHLKSINSAWSDEEQAMVIRYSISDAVFDTGRLPAAQTCNDRFITMYQTLTLLGSSSLQSKIVYQILQLLELGYVNFKKCLRPFRVAGFCMHSHIPCLHT